MKISALILAAGFSSRMGRFKPLLPLGEKGEKNVLQRVISLFQIPEIQEILVVTGHRAHDIEKIAGAMAVKTLFNPDYDKGMFSSVKTGVQALNNTCNAFFVMPVDIPLVNPDTIGLLLNAWQEKESAVIYPAFKGKRGHPPLVSMAIRDHILNWPGHQGLRGALKGMEDLSLEVETKDKYILMDMDHPGDYQQVQLVLNDFRSKG